MYTTNISRSALSVPPFQRLLQPGHGKLVPPISMAVMKPKLINPTAETFLRNEARGWFRASSQAWTLAVNLSKHERYIGQAISSGPLQCALGVSVRTEPRPWGLNQPVREDTLLCARDSVTTTGMRSDSQQVCTCTIFENIVLLPD